MKIFRRTKHRIKCGTFSYGIDRINDIAKQMHDIGHEVVDIKFNYNTMRSSFDQFKAIVWTHRKKEKE